MHPPSAIRFLAHYFYFSFAAEATAKEAQGREGSHSRSKGSLTVTSFPSHFSFEVAELSYGTRGGHGYGGPSKKSSGFGVGKGKTRNPFKLAKENFQRRSKRAQQQDLRRIAAIAPNIEVYLEHPDKYDFPGVDVPNDQQNVIDSLCQATCKSGTCDVQVKDKATKTSKRVRIVKAENNAFELKKAVDEAEAETKKAGRRLPSKEEIYQKAVELWRQQNNYLDNVANPSPEELKEEELLNRAKIALMTSADTDASREVDDFLLNTRQQLNAIGFDIVPLANSPFDSAVDDSKYADYLSTQ